MIYEILPTGIENAVTGKHLASVLGTDVRSITKQIEKERRDGKPICADQNNGYFLARDHDELQRYCKRLLHRESEMKKTRTALLGLIPKNQGQMKLWE